MDFHTIKEIESILPKGLKICDVYKENKYIVIVIGQGVRFTDNNRLAGGLKVKIKDF